MPISFKPGAAGGGGGGDNFARHYLAATAQGQTSFALPSTPQSPGKVVCLVDGLAQEYGATKDFTVSGTVLTWLNRHFMFSIGDVLEVQYFTA